MRIGILLVAGAFLLTPLTLTVGTPSAIAKPQKKRKKKRTKRGKKASKKATPAPPPETAKSDSDLVPSTALRGPTRLDFDDRLIQGQTNKSGAVYLFDRKETGISSMVRRRKSFRHLTIRTIYDR